MKIMVYTYGVGGLPTQRATDLIAIKQKELGDKFPYLKVLVVPGPMSDGDQVQMLDFTVPLPPVYPPLGGPVVTYTQQPPFTVQTNPYVSNTYTVTCGGIGISATGGGGYTSGGGAGLPGSSVDHFRSNGIKYGT